MRSALVRKAVLRFTLDGFAEEREFIVAVEEPGFALVFPLPVVELPENLRLVSREFREVPAAPPLTQGEPVELMWERRLGRPSTHARIVGTGGGTPRLPRRCSRG